MTKIVDVLISGKIGTGKTTLARLIRKAIKIHNAGKWLFKLRARIKERRTK